MGRGERPEVEDKASVRGEMAADVAEDEGKGCRIEHAEGFHGDVDHAVAAGEGHFFDFLSVECGICSAAAEVEHVGAGVEAFGVASVLMEGDEVAARSAHRLEDGAVSRLGKEEEAVEFVGRRGCVGGMEVFGVEGRKGRLFHRTEGSGRG